MEQEKKPAETADEPKPNGSEETAMEEAQKAAAEEREEEGGYQ